MRLRRTLTEPPLWPTWSVGMNIRPARPDCVVLASSCRFSGALSSREHLPGKGSDSPAHTHRRWRPAFLRAFNTHNKCTGVCRFVRGISVGIGHRAADLGGFCGAPQKPLTQPRPTGPVAQLPEADAARRPRRTRPMTASPASNGTARAHAGTPSRAPGRAFASSSSAAHTSGGIRPSWPPFPPVLTGPADMATAISQR